jgi:hypothetical protein
MATGAALAGFAIWLLQGPMLAAPGAIRRSA